MLRLMLFITGIFSIASGALASAGATDPAASTASPVMGLMPLVLIFLIFYFLMIRPQQKRYKEHQETLKTLKRGDKVVTGGGIHGTISKVEDDVVHVDITDAVTIRVARQSITEVVGDKPKADATAKQKKAKDGAESKKQVANDN